MNLPDRSHPIWSLARIVVVLGFVSFVLWLEASNFDPTEYRAILWTAFGLLGMEGGFLKFIKGRSE